MDLVMTAFCVITLLFIFFAGCGSTSKEEELLDTLLLVARNVLQFGRLASVMRQYVPLPVPCPTHLFSPLHGPRHIPRMPRLLSGAPLTRPIPPSRR